MVETNTAAPSSENSDDGMIWFSGKRMRRVMQVFVGLGFGVPLGLLSLFVLGFVAFYGYLWVRTGSWVETPARVTSVEWKVGKSRIGDEDEYEVLTK